MLLVNLLIPVSSFVISVPCIPLKEGVDRLTEEFGETMVWNSVDHSGKKATALLSNPSTGTWSLIEFDPETVCLIRSGIGQAVESAGQSRTKLLIN